MRCDSCILQDPAKAAEPSAVLAALLDCDECPLGQGAGGSAQTVSQLVLQLRHAAQKMRRQEIQLGKLRNETRELREYARSSEERVAKLEELQRATTREADAERQAKLALLREKEAAIAALSTPIIAVQEGVLVLPLIGALDDQRAESLTANLLDQIQTTRARYAIIDLTGVPQIDRHSARHLLRLAKAVQLLGSQTLLCGLRPQVARELVGLDVEVESILTARTLQEALQYCQKNDAKSPAKRADPAR